MKDFLCFRCCTLLLLTCFFCTADVHAQLASGLHLQRFAGVHGVAVNPASGLHRDLSWDINLGSVNAFGRNDYLHVKNASWLTILRGQADLSLPTTGEVPIDTTKAHIAFNQLTNRSHSAHAEIQVLGPSAWFSFDGLGIGVITSLRAVGSGKLPSPLGYDRYRNLPINQTISMPSTRINAASWSEYGISLSTDRLNYDASLSIGITAKYLRPHEGATLYVDGRPALTKVTNGITLDSTVVIVQSSGGIGSGTPQLMRNSGHGWAVDLGVSYQTEFATWGASILDIGSMTFSQQTAENRWVINKPSQINTDQLSLSNGTTSLSNQLDSQLSVDSSITRQRFSMQAPTSLRLSYDYYLSHDTYVSAELRQPIPIDRNALRTAPTVAVSWRKENRWWSITGSAVLTDYRELSLGIGARLGVVTIGTDDLLSIATKGNLSKGSIYAAVKINPFGTGGGGKVRCPRVKRSPFDSAQTVRGARRMGVYGRQM